MRCPERSIPESLDALILWSLEKKASDRIQSAAQFRDILAAWAEAAGLWPAEEKKRATQTNVLLKYFTQEQVRAIGSAPAKEGLRPTSSVLKRVTRARTPAAEDPTLRPLAVFGREQEQRQIDAFLRRKQPGRTLRIQGDVGLGKALLSEDARRQAVALGMEVIRCWPSLGWAKTVLGAAHRVALACLKLNEKDFGVEDVLMAAGKIGLAAEDIPGLKELFGFSSHLSDLDADCRRRERAAAFRHLVHAAAARKPLLILFEEIDRYDVPSRELILSLVASSCDHPLALLITHGLDFTQLWLPEVELLDLHPLADEACAELVRSLFVEEVSPLLVEDIVQIARGRPLFTEQLAYAESCEGIAHPPDKVADLMAARVERLSQEEREVLQWISVLGDWVDLVTLAKIMDQDRIEGRLLEELTDKGFLRLSRRGYGFVHHLLSMVVYSSIPAEVRRHIHGAIAEHIRQLDSPVTTIAFHAYEGDDGPRAVEELDRAGAWAIGCLDFDAAVQFYHRALEVVRREWGRGRVSEGDLDQMAVDLSRRLAEALRQSNDLPAARGVLEETLSVAAGEDASRACLRLDLGRIDLELGNLQRALRHLELAQADAAAARSDWLLGEVTRELARAVGLMGDRERSGALVLESLARSSKASGQKGSPPWNTLLDVANTCIQIGFIDRALGYLLDALQQADNERALHGRLHIVMRMAEVHLGSSEWSEAEMRLTQALDLATQVGDRTRKVRILTETGRLYRIRGDVELGRRCLEDAVHVARDIGWWEGHKRAEGEIEMLKYAIPQAL